MSKRNSDEPGSFEPGLEHVIRALTAHGHPQEFAGRDNALAAFRAASQPGNQYAPGAARRTRFSRARSPRLPGFLIPARLAAIAAAGTAAVFAGVTAAAYAQALPAPMQQIAHTVLAPLGVPNSHPESRSSRPATPTTSPASVAVTSGGQQSGAGVSHSAGCPCPATSTTPAHKTVTYVVTATANKVHVRWDGIDTFTGEVTAHGHPAKGIRIHLAEHVAGTPGWQLVASGVSGPRGMVWLPSPHLTAAATFELRGPDGSHSAPIAVTVGAPVVLRLTVGTPTDRLIVTAAAGSPGQTVWLTVLDNGTWEHVKSKPLGPLLHAEFTLPATTAAGHFYRAELTASGTRQQAVSSSVWVPRLRHGTGAKGIGGPTPSPTPTPSASGSSLAADPSASPTPTASISPTPSSSTPYSIQSSLPSGSASPTGPAPSASLTGSPAPATTAAGTATSVS